MNTRIASVLVISSFLFACKTDGPSSGADASVVADAALGSDAGTSPNDAGTSADASMSTEDAVLRMCLLNNACGYQSLLSIPADLCVKKVLDARQSSLTQYSPEHELRHERMIDCARTSTTCDDYIACARFDAECNGLLAGSCQGTVADRCSAPGDNYLPPIFDCALVGMTCDASGSSATCVMAAGANECDSAGTARCDGATRVHCRSRAGGGNGEYREECPSGTTCMGGGSSVICVPDYAACSTVGGTCDGDVAVMCAPMGAAGNRALRQDCGAAGRTCLLDDSDPRGTRSACVPSESACTAATGSGTTARCDGNAIEVCVEGRVERIECASVGRTSCIVAPAIPSVQPATPVCAE